MALKVDYTTSTSPYVVLSNTPTDGTVALDVIGGTAQSMVTDFIVNDSTVVLTNGSLIGSQLRMIYNK